ncbi:MAG: EamA family transporter [Chitinophagales bacterium]|nr:EamA family transporter [Chitinophagales bacterium]
MELKQKAYLQIHIAVFLWGITAILGKLISYSELVLVWYRMTMVSVLFLFFPSIYKELKTLSQSTIIKVGAIGILVALHWVCFYGSIKYANASVALSCLALTSFFTAIIEPIITKTPFNKAELLLGILVIPGIWLISQSINTNYYIGLILGLLAALLAAIFTSLNKKETQHTPPKVTVFIQLGCGALFLSLIMPIYLQFFPNSFYLPDGRDLILLIILAVICTILPYILYLKSLKVLTAFATNLINNLEPIYGIILAAIFFQENKELSISFYIGTLIILLAVFIDPMVQKTVNRPKH